MGVRKVGPSKFSILLDRTATTTIIFYNNILSQEVPLLRKPVHIDGPNEEAFRPQYRRDLGAMEEQRRGKQKLEDPDIVFPTSVTLMCFKVKVGAMLPPLLLSYFYFFFCQSQMFQSLVKRH